MRAKISQIPVAEDATWGAVYAALLLDHRKDWHFHWTGYRTGEPDAYSSIEIQAPGEDVDGMRAEIAEVVDVVNTAARRDPLNKMVAIDIGHVEVLVD